MKRSRINPISKKRREAMKVYSAQRADFLKNSPTCQKCNHRAATDIHHKAGRSGSNYLDMTTWAGLCRRCHRWVHDHPSKARERGWLT